VLLGVDDQSLQIILAVIFKASRRSYVERAEQLDGSHNVQLVELPKLTERPAMDHHLPLQAHPQRRAVAEPLQHLARILTGGNEQVSVLAPVSRS
jgi:hypothetical protein